MTSLKSLSTIPEAHDAPGSEPFGWSTSIDLYGCSRALLEDEAHIRAFVIELCDDVLSMVRHGDLIIDWFGGDAPASPGYTFVQLIETSCVTAHLSGGLASAHLDVFSCTPYDVDKVVDFCVASFEADGANTVYLTRHSTPSS